MRYSNTSIGYLHIRNNKPCQDFSATYHDIERDIVTTCDGHGGDRYVRSDRGSKFASAALIHVLSRIDKSQLRRLCTEPARNNLKLNILCEWNALVEQDLKRHPLKRQELAHLDDCDKKRLRANPIKAYGTTMIGVMAFGGKLIGVQIGDGGAFLVKNRHIVPMFEEDEDEPVGNMTYSMCEEDAFEHINIGVFPLANIQGALICTDGVINPYMSYANFDISFVKHVLSAIASGNSKNVDELIRELGQSMGNGDDVSLGVYLKDSVKMSRRNRGSDNTQSCNNQSSLKKEDRTANIRETAVTETNTDDEQVIKEI